MTDLDMDEVRRFIHDALTNEPPAEAETMAAAMRAALAEAGYPDCKVHPQNDGRVEVSPDAPREVIWRAFAICSPVCDHEIVCWPCFNRSPFDVDAAACEHDYREEPWP